MNSYERVMKRLNGEVVDKIPNMNIVMAFAAQNIGVSYSKYVTDYKSLVEANLVCCEKFGIDAVSAISDPMREAHSFGADVTIPENDVPYSKSPLITDFSMLTSLKAKSPYDDPRTLDRIMAVELYKAKVKHEYAIIGWVEGALAEAADLREISQLMMDLMLEPEAAVELFEIIYEQQLAFAKAQIDAGADIIGIGDAAASLIGPALYEEFAMPFEKRIVSDIHKLGAKAKLHICGNIEPILGLVKQVGADIVDIDHMVDFKKAVETFDDSISCACGNLDPVSIFLQGDSAAIEQAVANCIAVANSKIILAGGCEIPRETPHENMVLMNKLLAL